MKHVDLDMNLLTPLTRAQLKTGTMRNLQSFSFPMKHLEHSIVLFITQILKIKKF